MRTVTSSRTQLTASKRSTDWTSRLIVLCASIVSIVAYAYFSREGLTLVYKDAISHLQIAERVIHSPTAGFAQLGGVWLPLPHLLTLPFVWIASFYYNGFAGSIVSMISYVIATYYVYKIVFGLTRMRLPAIVSVLVFALNPNVLYMQSTPMTELLLFATILAMVYYAQQWIQTERYVYLFASAFAAVLGCITRYEAWVVTIVLTIVIAVIACKRYGFKQAEGIVLGYGFLAWSAIVGWAGWNWLILGNPLNFQIGEYSKPSLWVGADEPAYGNWAVAIKTYWYAVTGNIGIAIVVLMIVGIIAMCIHRRADTAPSLSLLIMVVFFIVALHQGQRPLHVMQVSEDLYNVRFGLMVVIVAAIAIGYLASVIRHIAWSIVILAVALGATLAVIPAGGIQDIVTVREPVAYIEKGSNTPLTPVSNFLHENYRGGKILMESFGSETILFNARVSLSENIYEGSYKLWEPALEDPLGSNIEWIVMRHGSTPDKVYETLNGSPILDDYTLVYQNDTYLVYERK